MKTENPLTPAELKAIKKSMVAHSETKKLELSKQQATKKKATERKDIKRFSAWEVVGCDVLEVLEAQPANSVSGTQLVALVVAAICPTGLVESIKSPQTSELARVYLGFYAKQPDLVLRLLAVVREKWNRQKNPAKIQRHILTNAWHQKPSATQNGILQQDAQDKETVSVVLGPNFRGDVKKARQHIKLPSWWPNISIELNAALLELKKAGFDVGWGC